MIAFVLALVLLAISLVGVALRKVYYYLPAKELKRQAEGGSVLARKLWQAVSYGASLRVYLWLWIGITAAAGFVLLAHVAPWYFGLVVTALVIWLAFAWFPSRIKVSGVEARLTTLVTPLVAWQLHYLHPLLDRTLVRLVHKPETTHTALYETADLLELLDRQQAQDDNRIPQSDIARAQQALSAHQYSVSDVMLPRQQVRMVSDSDTVGLVMLDELHATGQSSFPVRQGTSDKIIGTLYLHDLGLKTEGRVRDYMQSEVRYLHEDDTLDQALQAFYKTRQQSFVVVNSFEEFVGIATLEAITRHLAGEAQADAFDLHHDLAAVAAKHAHDNEPEPEPELHDTEAEPDEVAVPTPEDEDAHESNEPAGDVVADGEVLADDDELTVVAEDDEEGDVPAPVTTTTAETEPVRKDAGTLATDEPETAETADETTVDPDTLAALDLPEDEAEPSKPTDEPAPETTKAKKPKTKPAKSDAKVVE